MVCSGSWCSSFFIKLSWFSSHCYIWTRAFRSQRFLESAEFNILLPLWHGMQGESVARDCWSWMMGDWTAEKVKQTLLITVCQCFQGHCRIIPIHACNIPTISNMQKWSERARRKEVAVGAAVPILMRGMRLYPHMLPTSYQMPNTSTPWKPTLLLSSHTPSSSKESKTHITSLSRSSPNWTTYLVLGSQIPLKTWATSPEPTL